MTAPPWWCGSRGERRGQVRGPFAWQQMPLEHRDEKDHGQIDRTYQRQGQQLLLGFIVHLRPSFRSLGKIQCTAGRAGIYPVKLGKNNCVHRGLTAGAPETESANKKSIGK